MQVLLKLGLQWIRPLLRANLHNAIKFPSSRDKLLAFPMVVCERLLDIHVFPRLACPNGSQHMPMIAHGNNDGIDIVVVV